jgi:hypothetical protein
MSQIPRNRPRDIASSSTLFIATLNFPGVGKVPIYGYGEVWLEVYDVVR